MTGPSLIQETNIERTLNDHLWNEIFAVRDKQTALQSELALLSDREELLLNIAHAARLPQPERKTP